MTLKPSRLPFKASLGGVSQDREMISGDVAVAWTFSGGRLGTEEGMGVGGAMRHMINKWILISNCKKEVFGKIFPCPLGCDIPTQMSL